MATYTDHLSTPVNEQSVALLSGTFQDEDGTALADTDFSTVVLTLTDYRSGAVINSLGDADVLNAGRGTVSAAGVYQITLSGDDNAFIGTAGQYEVHVALIEATYSGKVLRHEHWIRIRNLRQVS